MNRSRWIGVFILLFCVGISTVWSFAIRRHAEDQIRMTDFGALYLGARCRMRHIDPYNSGAVLQELNAELYSTFLKRPAPLGNPVGFIYNIYLPAAFFLIVPFALLPWGIAQALWTLLTAAALALAASLLWDLGAKSVPPLWICLAGFILANCELVFAGGNVASIAVAFCILAVWCFLTNRYAWTGILLLGIGLALKPHDTGFIWLYFIIAGGTLRKRALQSLLAAAVLTLLAVIWIAPVSPHWISELHDNLITVSVPGSTSDPGPSGMTSRSAGQIIDLQAAISIFSDNPHTYNPISYSISGLLILLWILAAWRHRSSSKTAPLALAAIAVLSLLPIYHRPYDAKLLLLTIPACAMLWKRGGSTRWIALLLTSAGIVVTSDIPLAILVNSTRHLPIHASTLEGRLLAVVLLRPAPVSLLALGCFYLWSLARHNPSAELPEQDEAAGKPAAARAF